MLTITAEAKDKYEFESFTINKEVMGKDAKGVTKVTDKVKYTYKLEVKSSTVIGATFSKPTFADDILAQTKDFAVVDGSIYCPGASMIALYTMDGKLVRTIEAVSYTHLSTLCCFFVSSIMSKIASLVVTSSEITG